MSAMSRGPMPVHLTVSQLFRLLRLFYFYVFVVFLRAQERMRFKSKEMHVLKMFFLALGQCPCFYFMR